MATITTTSSPTPQLNAWNVPPGYQTHGIPRAEIVFSELFAIAAIGAGDVAVVNINLTPPAQYYYRLADLSLLLVGTTEADMDDFDESAFCQFRNFRTGGVNAQTRSFQLMNSSFSARSLNTVAGLSMLSVTSAFPFGSQYTMGPYQVLPGVILSTVGGVGDVFITLENAVASSDGGWECFIYGRMLQYDVSDEFEYLLHTPVPVLPG